MPPWRAAPCAETMKTISSAILLLAASVAVVVSAEEQAQCVKKTHDKAAAGVWAAKHFKTYLKDHPQVALGCDRSCCMAICDSAEVAGRIECAIQIFPPYDCGINVIIEADACRLACPAAASAVLTTPMMKSHDLTVAKPWAAQFFEEYKQTHASILTPPNHPHFKQVHLNDVTLVGSIWCQALCVTAEVACQAACAATIVGEPECGIACGIAISTCEAAC